MHCKRLPANIVLLIALLLMLPHKSWSMSTQDNCHAERQIISQSDSENEEGSTEEEEDEEPECD